VHAYTHDIIIRKEFEKFTKFGRENARKGGNMGKEIDFVSLGWTEGDDFIAFAFGDFNSKLFYIQNPQETDIQK
jgi:hypothetical protein